MSERYSPKLNVVMWSPYFSSRGNAVPTLIVLHATASHNVPGLTDLENVGYWFQDPRSRVSAHVCTDNEGHSARYVRDYNKAWGCAAYNRMALNIEQILPGDASEITLNLYKETARWVALWSKKYHIPIQMAAVSSSGYIIRPGVIRHSSLGILGGGHTDPGKYDTNSLITLAKFYRSKI